MRKDEIILKYEPMLGQPFYYNQLNIERMMDEYAQAFYDWCFDNKVERESNSERWFKVLPGEIVWYVNYYELVEEFENYRAPQQ
jgi:hypothetical protein